MYEGLERDLKQYYTSKKGSTTTTHNCPINCCGHPANGSYFGADGVMYNTCLRDGNVELAVDINGYEKGPNKWGIDLFSFLLDENDKIVTWTQSNCIAHSKTGDTNVNDGMGCSYWALTDPDYFKNLDW